MFRVLSLFTTLLFFVSSCSTVGIFKSANGLEIASFDLKCPKEKLDVKELSTNQVAVQGCGKSARYVHAGQAGWVKNSEQ